MSPALHATGTAGILASYELDRDLAGLQGTYGWTVMSGAVTFNTGLTFNVASTAIGDNTTNGVVSTVAYSASTVVLNAQDATNPRVDLIVITSAGAVSAIPGTPKALTTTSGPVPTAPSASQLEIARIYVPASGTALSAASITDRRVPLAVPNPFDLIRVQFRANRRLVAEWTPQSVGTDSTTAVLPSEAQGIGFSLFRNATAGDIVTSLTGEPYQGFSTAAANGGAGIWTTTIAGAGALLATLSPSHSPRMLIRVLLPAATANLTQWQAGFMIALSDQNGAFIRLKTTGDAFFVTRQGGVETATNIGTLSRVVMLGFEIESVDAGVTWVLRNQAGTALATHTTNVPTAATALTYAIGGNTATGAVPWGIAYARVEGTFA